MGVYYDIQIVYVNVRFLLCGYGSFIYPMRLYILLYFDFIYEGL